MIASGLPVLLLFAMTLPDAPGETVRLPVVRDNWFSDVGAEAGGNNGGSPRLKLKSYQEMTVIDVDPAPLRGRVVTGATLHLHLAGDQPVRRVTVGSFGSTWVEGTGRSYDAQPGSSTFRSRAAPNVPWTPDGGDLCRVILGQAGTVWKMADASQPDPRQWLTVAVDPSVVAARVAGVSGGFLVFDDTGSEWTRAGEKFTTHHMPNRFVSSREDGPNRAPYLTVTLGPADRSPPAAPGDVRSEAAGLPAGEAFVSWTTPRDVGTAGTVGFFVTVGRHSCDRSDIPRARGAGERVVMHLRDTGITGGGETVVTVAAVDGAGNVGPPAKAMVRLSAKQPAPLPGQAPEPFAFRGGDLPKLAGATVAVIDELDKVQPVDGRLIPDGPRNYMAANHLWSAAGKRVRLHAARNEFAAFQVVIGDRGVRAALRFDGPAGPKLRAEFGRYRLVGSKLGPLPDPIVPLGGAEDTGGEPEGAKGQSLHVEVYVPHDAPAGDHAGTLTLTSGGQTLTLAVALRVWDFTLPDALSFLPEMNCYGLPPNERAFYRLAHRHRTVLNRVPYSHNGKVADGCAPVWDGRRFDWSAWDTRFGPLLDGSAFADLPRKAVPIECFYLPLFENWPTPIEPNYNGSYWADHAFTPSYRAAFVEASRRFADHMNKAGWDETLFHCFFNGKNDFKRGGWSRATSPWLLDEPGSFQDFWALRWFGAAFHEGVRRAPPGRAKLVYRCDISRPEWQRDSLDGLLDYNVVGGAFRRYRRIVLDRKRAEGQIVVEYGSANAVEESNMQAVGWSLDAWSLGTDGVLPWQTVGRGDSWQTADTLSLFYPGRLSPDPVPSVRLKAYRRGQQDVEYLTLLSLTTGEPRWAVAGRVREALGLQGERGASGADAVEDAGVIRYKSLRPQDAWALRVRIGQALSDAHPAPKRKLVDLRTPPRDPSKLEPGEVAAANEKAR